MAKINKKGLEYFSINVGMLDDLRLHRATRMYGSCAVIVYVALLCMTYQEQGYYLDMREQNRELVLLALYDKLRGEPNMTDQMLEGILSMLVDANLFDRDQYEQGILTSKQIQEQFYRATERRKNVRIDPTYWLLTVQEMQDMGNNTGILSLYIEPKKKPTKHKQDADIVQHDVDKTVIQADFVQHDVTVNAQNVDKSTQSKAQQSKEKKSIEKDRKAQQSTATPVPTSCAEDGFISEIAVLIDQNIELNFVEELQLYLMQGMEKDLIVHACQRTLLKNPHNRCAYLRSILQNYYSSKTYKVSDINAKIKQNTPEVTTNDALTDWEVQWLAEHNARMAQQSKQLEEYNAIDASNKLKIPS